MIPTRTPLLALALAGALGACAPQVTRSDMTPDGRPIAPSQAMLSTRTLSMYGATEDDGHDVPAIDPAYLSDEKARHIVDYWTKEPPGTIIVDPWARKLYYVMKDNKAMQYTVAVGRAGKAFHGTAHIPYQRDWPSWKPTQSMIEDDPKLYGPYKDGLGGGLDNPLGARALYLHKGNRDTFYRIHGTMEPWSIGEATSAGCIRLFNQDVINLAKKVRSGTRVVVLTQAQSGEGTVPPGHPLPSQHGAMQITARGDLY
ncbi:L,D-transpeptidase [Acidimangrovimonas sediminis]|uniref:L,D-transpeptidase n=1 Tax=Acidimangrovimonas sediminis TaxID=2056283 RepID=UPI001E5B57B2|nr:L,D-transpeptidase [Acidimangrovimonas sediminis]